MIQNKWNATPCASAAALVATAVTLACVAPAHAVELQTDNPDLSVRLDNTVRLNYGVRVEKRDDRIGNSALSDEGDYSFDRGDAVAKRLDLLTEFDVTYRKKYGLRVSAAGWADAAYGSRGKSNPALAALASYPNNEYSDYTKRFYRGASGEVLDAFVFGGFDIGDVPVQAKLGRHTLYWGESLFLGGNLHSVAYAQNPLDLQKGSATPGVEAKEIFRPLNQISAQAQLSDTLSVSAQYLLEWESFRYPEGGTYLGPVDLLFNGPNRQFLSAALGFVRNGGGLEPKQHGEWGVAARWSPAWLDGTVGAYYRDFADKLPQVFLTQAAPNNSVYNLIYADKIQLFGLSLAKNVGGVSAGAELSYRRNTPLTSQTLGIAPGRPAEGETSGPRGDTAHALVNAVGVIGRTGLWDTASWATELTWSHWTKVRSGARLFNAIGFAPCVGRDKWDGCVTRNFVGFGASFSPTWFQVFPGVDLSLPITYSRGLYGNAATTVAGNQASGSYSIGVGADVFQKYRFDLKFVDSFGRYRTNAAGTTVATQNGTSALLGDRGFVSLTFKTTF
ncbi:MAG TPA: DUF1302 domain-containing protein [Burkholderiaceae bacterium]|nr:DUF1302 domain-containing protein [Burkholderiaceae bacterium]